MCLSAPQHLFCNLRDVLNLGITNSLKSTNTTTLNHSAGGMEDKHSYIRRIRRLLNTKRQRHSHEGV